MSLDVTLINPYTNEELYEANITHNLGKMATEARIYREVWHPNMRNIYKAGDIVGALEAALRDMTTRSAHYKEFSSDNGWGTYEDFIPWLERYLEACKKNPDAKIITNS